MYKEFKDKLLAEFEETRDILVTQKRKRGRESLLGISKESDKIYANLIMHFERIALNHIRQLILDLYKKYNIKVSQGNNMMHSLKIGDEPNEQHIIILNKTESINSEQFAMLRDSLKRTDSKATFVFLLSDTLENRRAIEYTEYRFYNDTMYTDIKGEMSCLLFEDFIFDTFGEKEAEEFNKMLNEFKEDFRNVLGYQITEICSPHNLSKLRNELSLELKNYPYQNIKNRKFAEDIKPLELKDFNYDKIRLNYIDGEKYKMMLSIADFAESFLTSEWLYKKYVLLDQLDNTFIVTGYLKSVEQLLWDIIKLKGQGKKIKDKTIGVANDNEIDTTLGALEHFIGDQTNKGLYLDAFGGESKTFVIRYVRSQVASWREKRRNGFFHKHNLKKKENIDLIREETLYLYFLILGSIYLTDDQVKKLTK